DLVGRVAPEQRRDRGLDALAPGLGFARLQYLLAELLEDPITLVETLHVAQHGAELLAVPGRLLACLGGRRHKVLGRGHAPQVVGTRVAGRDVNHVPLVIEPAREIGGRRGRPIARGRTGQRTHYGVKHDRLLPQVDRLTSGGCRRHWTTTP